MMLVRIALALTLALPTYSFAQANDPAAIPPQQETPRVQIEIERLLQEAEAYERGLGIRPNQERANSAYEEAASLGSDRAMLALAEIHARSNPNKAVQWAALALPINPEETKRFLNRISLFGNENFPKDMVGLWGIEDFGCKSEKGKLLILHDQVLSLNPNKHLISAEKIYAIPGHIIYLRDDEIEDFHTQDPITQNRDRGKKENLRSRKISKCSLGSQDLDYLILQSDAFEFDQFIIDLKNDCRTDALHCIDRIWTYGDVSGNESLSKAEITRMMRHLIKWISLSSPNLDEQDGYAALATIMTTAPLLSNLILANYDYNYDEHLDKYEISHDMANILESSTQREAARSLLQLRENIPSIDARDLKSLLDTFVR
jgi:hypothetical protein